MDTMEDSELQQLEGGPLLSLGYPKYSFSHLYRRTVLLTLSLLNYSPAQLKDMCNPSFAYKNFFSVSCCG